MTIFDEPDLAGHYEAFHMKSNLYRQTIKNMDHIVGKMLETIRGRSTFKDEEWYVVVGTDHGGVFAKHGGINSDVINIWMIVSSLSISKYEEFVLPYWLIDRNHQFSITLFPRILFFLLGLKVERDWNWDDPKRNLCRDHYAYVNIRSWKFRVIFWGFVLTILFVSFGVVVLKCKKIRRKYKVKSTTVSIV